MYFLMIKHLLGLSNILIVAFGSCIYSPNLHHRLTILWKLSGQCLWDLFLFIIGIYFMSLQYHKLIMCYCNYEQKATN